MVSKLNKAFNEEASPVDEMSDFTLARWAALVEAVNVVADMAEEKGVKFKKISLKQPALRKYVDSTCDIICRKIKEENKMKRQAKAYKESYSLTNA